jgi:enoyl-CoA hydratase/carnithine racemase
MQVKRDLRRIETLGKPVVAAINGAALGGGLEIALACHHRIALEARDSTIGLPEVTFGLLPGAGGVTRAVRLLGVADAITVLLEGKRYVPAQAKEVGLVHEVAGAEQEMLARARAFIAANPEIQQPWDVKGHTIPGGTPAHPKLATRLPAFAPALVKQTGGAPCPARRSILAAAVECSQVDFDTAQVIEAQYFVELVTGQISTNMIQAFFFDRRSAARDTRGVFASRVLGHVVNEGVAMVGEGVEPAAVEQASAQAGYYVKALALADELMEAEGAAFPASPRPAKQVIGRMVDEFGRLGRRSGAGFYEYDEDGTRRRLWPGLREHFTKTGPEAPDIPFADMQERMLFAAGLDTVRLFAEGALTSVAEANIGSSVGLGFPAWTGGVIQYINGYAGGSAGPAGFAARARELQARYGDRFAVPEPLAGKAARGEAFSDNAA